MESEKFPFDFIGKIFALLVKPDVFRGAQLMKISFIYPDTVNEIRFACIRHISGLASADDLQCVVQRGEAMIIALEEKDIRCFLTDIESDLELVKFTVDTEKQLIETQQIARKVLVWFLEREMPTRLDKVMSCFYRNL